MTARRELCWVTGTDTGVGKTFVSRGLLRQCARRGLAVFPLKLVETGCVRTAARLRAGDGEALARAAGLGPGADSLVAPLRFELPASPAAAARAAGAPLQAEALSALVARAAEASQRVLLEGAGGLLAPLTDTLSFADFVSDVATRLGLDVRLLVVARDALGTLNHTLLTVEAAERRGLSVAAVVLNATSGVRCALDHRDELLRLRPELCVLGPTPWRADASDDDAADALVSVGMSEAVAFPRLVDSC
ncbi:MAG: dethiobiotin synthase [Polyangiaceae bacterium]|nr:dethiobiotin synthase [Polyangiaceae bacterium]